MIWDGFYERKKSQERDINTSADLRSGVYKIMALIMCGDWEKCTRIYFEDIAMLFYFSKHRSKVIGLIWPQLNYNRDFNKLFVGS